MVCGLDATQRSIVVGDEETAIVRNPRYAEAGEVSEQHLIGHRHCENATRIGQELLRGGRLGELIDRLGRVVRCLLSLRGHLVEGRPESADLVVTVRLDSLRIIAFGDRFGGLSELVEWTHELPANDPRHDSPEDDEENRDHRERADGSDRPLENGVHATHYRDREGCAAHGGGRRERTSALTQVDYVDAVAVYARLPRGCAGIPHEERPKL